MNALDKLNTIRTTNGRVITKGLNDSIIAQFLNSDPTLAQAIDNAYYNFNQIKSNFLVLLIWMNPIK
jgi:hypothetical protein